MTQRAALKAQLERAEKKGRADKVAKLEAELFPPPPPEPLRYLWDIYARLRRRKASAGFGTPPIEWPDIDAFLRHAGLRLSPVEIEMIEAIDDCFITIKNAPRPD